MVIFFKQLLYLMMNNYRTVIFDFDGTLANTLELVQEIIIKIGPRYRLKTEGLQLQELRDLPAEDIMKVIGLRKYLLPFFVAEIKFRMKKSVKNIVLYEGIKECLLSLHKEGYRIEILSSNATNTILNILEIQGLSHVVDKVYASSKLFSKHKILTKIKKKTNLNLLYIGDEVRDYVACQKANISMIGVSWGFNSEKALSDAHLQKIISDVNLLNFCIHDYFDNKK